MADSDELRELAEDVRRNQRRVSSPQRMADAVNGLMARRGYAQLQATDDQRRVWNEAVGSRLSPHTRPGNLKRGVLEVFVRSSLIVQELTFQKKQLLVKLAAARQDQLVRDLRFRVGAID